MAWKEASKMELKAEFVQLADQPSANMTQLCRRFNISRPTGYKWLRRYRAEGIEGLEEHARRPHHSPNKTPKYIEQLVVKARGEDPGWGGSKLRLKLLEQAEAGLIEVTPDQIPAASTITRILQRHGLLNTPEAAEQQGPWQRFEREKPNELWQIDFKGQFQLLNQSWCYPLTLIDDHSRFGLAVAACSNQRYRTVKGCLQQVFSRYGLPKAFLCDNGSPWGSSRRFPDGSPHYTKLSAWLIRRGVSVYYSRPGHPQSKGKNERFNRTLGAELLRFERFRNHRQAQESMAGWRVRYNTKRPHRALDMATPASRYQPSQVEYPAQPAAIEYGPDDYVRKVCRKGIISFQGHSFRVGKAFSGHPVALRATSKDKEFNIYFCHQHIRTINLHQNLN